MNLYLFASLFHTHTTPKPTKNFWAPRRLVFSMQHCFNPNIWKMPKNRVPPHGFLSPSPGPTTGLPTKTWIIQRLWLEEDPGGAGYKST